MAWQDTLNELQKAAIASQSTNQAVVAGPGTGKTKTIIHKALQLIEEENTQSDKLRIVNFTNAGVFDLRKRISIDPTYSAVDPNTATTFHSLALRVLRAVRCEKYTRTFSHAG